MPLASFHVNNIPRGGETSDDKVSRTLDPDAMRKGDGTDGGVCKAVRNRVRDVGKLRWNGNQSPFGSEENQPEVATGSGMN